MTIPRGLAAAVVVAGLVVAGCASTPPAALEGKDFPITVDYSRSVEELLQAGHYGWAFSELNSNNFPVGRTGSRAETARLVKLDRYISIDKLVSQQEAQGWRPADIQELLTFGEAYPDVQMRSSVVGFGSSKKYTTIEYDHLMGPMDVQEDLTVQDYYPTLLHGLLGRSVALIKERLIPSYDLGGFYACFIHEAPPSG